MHIYNLDERKDSFVLTIKKRITGCCVGTGFEILLLDGEDEIRIRIGGCFVLKDGDISQTFDPDQPTTLASALRIIYEVVESAVAYKNGQLEINFSNGMILSAGPDPHYESWQISGRTPIELLIVCAPGGELAVWYE